MAWLFYFDQQGVLVWVLLACVLHELGHYLAIYLVGARSNGLRLSAVGAEISIQGRLSYGKEWVVAVAGPVVNFICALATCQLHPMFAGIHLSLGLFNLIPILPLDGGRCLGAALCMVLPPHQTEQIQAVAGVVVAMVLVCAGAFVTLQTGAVTLLLLGLWLCKQKLVEPTTG